MTKSKYINTIIDLVEDLDLVPDAPAREWRGPYGIHSGRGARRRAIEDAIEEEIRWFGCRLSPEQMAERASYRVTPVEDVEDED